MRYSQRLFQVCFYFYFFLNLFFATHSKMLKCPNWEKCQKTFNNKVKQGNHYKNCLVDRICLKCTTNPVFKSESGFMFSFTYLFFTWKMFPIFNNLGMYLSSHCSLRSSCSCSLCNNYSCTNIYTRKCTCWKISGGRGRSLLCGCCRYGTWGKGSCCQWRRRHPDQSRVGGWLCQTGKFLKSFTLLNYMMVNFEICHL